MDLSFSLSVRNSDEKLSFSMKMTDNTESKDWVPVEDWLPQLTQKLKKWLLKIHREYDLQLNQMSLDEAFKNLVRETLEEAGALGVTQHKYH